MFTGHIFNNKAMQMQHNNNGCAGTKIIAIKQN